MGDPPETPTFYYRPLGGESGAGKELVARALHAASARRGRRFCAINCAALSDELVEAELFGHARGAFTGAIAERVGLFEDAPGSTVFLDEVAELTHGYRPSCGRTLQEGGVRRVGLSSFARPGEVTGVREKFDLLFLEFCSYGFFARRFFTDVAINFSSVGRWTSSSRLR